MLVIKNKRGDFYKGVKNVQGQPMAVGTPWLDDAKQFSNIAKLRAEVEKWTGAGVCIESFDQLVDTNRI